MTQDFEPVLLTPEMVVRIHDAVLNPGEVQGMAGGKSLEGALSRVETRLMYGDIPDAPALAAAYALAVSRGHCFNDGNKRTSYRVMSVALALNGAPGLFLGSIEESGDLIVAMARGDLPEEDLADRIRSASLSFNP